MMFLSGGPPAATATTTARSRARAHVRNRFRPTSSTASCARPPRFPRKISRMIKEDEAPPQMAVTGVVGGVPGGVPGGSMGGVIGSVLSSTPVAVPKIATPTRVRVSSGVSTGLLIRKVHSGVSAAGAPGAHSGRGDSPGADQQRRQHPEPAVDQRAPDAGAGRDRSREAVEVQAVPAERRAGRGRHAGAGELHARWGLNSPAGASSD